MDKELTAPVVLGKRKCEELPEEENIWHRQKRAKTGECSWDDLPSELLSKILVLVPPGEDLCPLFTVSKRWEATLTHSHFWHASFEHWFDGTPCSPDSWRQSCETAASEMNTIEREHADPIAAAHHLWFWAAHRGHRSTMQRLLGQYPLSITVNMQNTESRSALYIACMEGHVGVVDMLLEAGANVDITRFNGATPLHSACWNGHTQIVQRLIEARANVNATHNTGSTGLHSSAWKGHVDVVRTLLDAGADVNARRHDGVKPLHEACWRGELDVVKALLAAGADIDSVRDDGMTALCAAAQQGHVEVLRELLKAGANVRIANRDGITPLHAACLGGSVEVVQMLLSKGADPTALATVADETAHVVGRTPAMLAESKQHTEIARLLQEAAAGRATAAW